MAKDKSKKEKSQNQGSKKAQDKYVVRSNFFYKGVQFHAGQEIGFSEDLFKIGKIEKKKEEKLGFDI